MTRSLRSFLIAGLAALTLSAQAVADDAASAGTKPAGLEMRLWWPAADTAGDATSGTPIRPG